MSTILRVTTIAILMSLLTACSRSPEQAMFEDTGNLVIMPLHERFLADSLSLAEFSKSFCTQQGRTEKDLAAMRSHWISVMNAWEGIQSISFGPVTQDNQAWKVQFWPDRKNLVARKTEQFIRHNDGISLDSLRKASVVIQGLSAMEYLLYDAPATSLLEPGPYCEHLVAASENLRQVAEFLYQSWSPDGDDYLSKWQNPAPANLEYPDDTAVISSIVEAMVYELDLIKRDKLDRPLALSEGSAPNTYLLEWWRSKQSSQAIVVNLQSLEQLYSAGKGDGLQELLAAHGASDLSKKIDGSFTKAINLALSIPGSIFDQHSNPITHDTLVQLHATVDELEKMLKREVPAALGITIGFNANDGD